MSSLLLGFFPISMMPKKKKKQFEHVWKSIELRVCKQGKRVCKINTIDYWSICASQCARSFMNMHTEHDGRECSTTYTAISSQHHCHQLASFSCLAKDDGERPQLSINLCESLVSNRYDLLSRRPIHARGLESFRRGRDPCENEGLRPLSAAGTFSSDRLDRDLLFFLLSSFPGSKLRSMRAVGLRTSSGGWMPLSTICQRRRRVRSDRIGVIYLARLSSVQCFLMRSKPTRRPYQTKPTLAKFGPPIPPAPTRAIQLNTCRACLIELGQVCMLVLFQTLA